MVRRDEPAHGPRWEGVVLNARVVAGASAVAFYLLLLTSAVAVCIQVVEDDEDLLIKQPQVEQRSAANCKCGTFQANQWLHIPVPYIKVAL
jgi:hypothetical protein